MKDVNEDMLTLRRLSLGHSVTLCILLGASEAQYRDHQRAPGQHMILYPARIMEYNLLDAQPQLTWTLEQSYSRVG
jgi:hypothetical protein